MCVATHIVSSGRLKSLWTRSYVCKCKGQSDVGPMGKEAEAEKAYARRTHQS